VRDGWLDRDGLAQVCRSFGDAPPTPTHPSGARRCANLYRCFATATVTFAQRQRPRGPAAERQAASTLPQLTAGPTLVRTGRAPLAR
jgi:hypothetical protein